MENRVVSFFLSLLSLSLFSSFFSRETSFHLLAPFPRLIYEPYGNQAVPSVLREHTNYRQLSGVLFTNSTGRPNGKRELARDLSGGNYSPCYEICFFFFPPPPSPLSCHCLISR